MLIAIFVLLFGLLGVAALIPVGQLLIVQTAQADRSAACGRAGLCEVKARRMLNPRQWRIREDDPPPPLDKSVLLAGDVLPRRESFAIDPLFVAETDNILPTQANDPNVIRLTRFPYYLISDPPSGPRMWRYSLAVPAWPSPSGPRRTMQLSVASRIFTWHDDLLFPVPDDESDRPRQIIACVDGNGNPLFVTENIAWPARQGDDDRFRAAGYGTAEFKLLYPKAAQNLGHYTWMVTVVPKPDRDPSGTLLPPNVDKDRLYSVSIVVFYRRDFSPPSDPSNPQMPGERVVQAEVFSGWGGGEVRLIAPAGQGATYLELREGEWLLLMDDPGGDCPYLFQWYRIVAVDDLQLVDVGGTDRWTRYVTLAGPDWSGRIFDPADPPGTTIQAGLFTGVIGVYTTTAELDGENSPWVQ